MEGPSFSKRRKLSKNKKKSWRGIDISSTEEFLEDERFQQRTTGIIREKSDDQLFVVERGISTQIRRNAHPRRSVGELRCYTNLTNRSKIECPRKEYPTDANFEAKAVQRETRSFLAAKRGSASAKDNAASQQTGNTVDLWGEEEKDMSADNYFDEITKRKRVQTPEHIKRKVSLRPAVEVPHPGASVNPTYNDHQDLLLQAHLVEVQKEKAERKLFNALDAKFPSLSEAPTEATWIKEMSVGLFSEKNHADEEVDDNQHISINLPINRERKKTPRDRRKEKAAKMERQEIVKKKAVKQRENKVFSIPRIKSELARERRETKKRAELKAKKQEDKKFIPKKLGKTKVITPDLEVKLSHELVGNLRGLKPEGHLLEDRYKSLQLRNVIEPRSKVKKQKIKRKIFEKKSFREVKV